MNNDNTKKVLRIALVAVRPADQVMLKGYLRLLMRLEADLEWVSANHEAVDLFMINSEFQQADSVQHLISAKPDAAVLYITRTDAENGYLTGSLLTLPIKDLDPLNRWLYANLKFLSGQTPAKTQQNDIAPQKRQSLDELIASRQNQPNSNPTQNTAQSANTATTATTAFDKSIAIAFAKILNRLYKKEDNLFSLNDKNGTLLAYIQPKQQRIWQIQPKFTASEWTLNVANPTDLNPAQSQDLVQFFWQFGLKNAKHYQPFINATNQYHIKSWVKPENNSQRHNALKVQCVLEPRPVNLAEVIQLSGVDAKVATVMVIALILSGVMDNSVYDSLEKTVAEFHKDMPAPETVAPVQTAHMPTNQTTASLQQEIKAELPQQAKEENSGMKGFLSRLRSKLGI